jgi:glycosyltransferase involved in cell wall biosynthesis
MAETTATIVRERSDQRLVGLRRIVIVPAFNEERSIAAVIAEIRAADPEFELVVIDDGSTDRTAAVAAAAGANVLTLPFNLGIGGAVQTGYQYALEKGFDLAVQVDGDGQHDPGEIASLLEPILDGQADMVVGTRFATAGGYRGTRVRRVGIRLFAAIVSLIVRARVTDTTSGFRAVNRKAIRLFAADYPPDYPEAEATVLLARHKLRMVEVPMQMRVRETGNSSIRDIVWRLGDLLGQQLSVVLDEKRLRPRDSEVERLLADSSKAKARLGWASEVALEEGLRRTIEEIQRSRGFDNAAVYNV